MTAICLPMGDCAEYIVYICTVGHCCIMLLLCMCVSAKGIKVTKLFDDSKILCRFPAKSVEIKQLDYSNYDAIVYLLVEFD